MPRLVLEKTNTDRRFLRHFCIVNDIIYAIYIYIFIVPGGRVCEFPPVEVSRGEPRSAEVSRGQPRSADVSRGEPRSAEVSRGQPINTKATTRQISAGQKNRRATA